MALADFEFRTQFSIAESTAKISLQTPILTMGSCFAEAIGGRLKDAKIPTLVNPFGTIFNPVSIEKLLTQAIDNQSPDLTLLVQSQEVWFHYDWHSSFWANEQTALANQLRQKAQEVNTYLPQTKFLLLTLGTAFVYRHIETDQIVANCHKMPSQYFKREMLSVAQVVNSIERIYQQVKTIAPTIQLVLTVSPVRHTRDTLPLNAVSKSILRVACHELEQSLADVQYFPAYELLLDDLRDYRFYKPDLIHPSDVAEAYIFEHFANAYFDPSLKDFLKEWNKVKQGLAHRPLQADTPAHRKFLTHLLQKLQTLHQQTDMSAEIEACEGRLEGD